MTSRTHRRFWHEFNRLPAHVQCLAREKFQFGCVIRFTLQCSSSRLSETSGQYESEITIALLRRSTAMSSSGFGFGTHEDYNNFIKQLR